MAKAEVKIRPAGDVGGTDVKTEGSNLGVNGVPETCTPPVGGVVLVEVRPPQIARFLEEVFQLEGGIKLLKMNLFNAIGQGYSFLPEMADSKNPYLDQIVLSDRLSALLPPSHYYLPEEEFAAGVTETELLDVMVEAKKLEKKLALGEYLPAVGVSYGYSSFMNDNFNAFGVATVSIPISNWGKGSQRLKRLDYQIQKAANEKEHLTSQLVLQARQLWLNLNVAWEQIKVAEENVALAQKTVYNQLSQFNAGLVPLSDLLMNQTSLFEATENLISKQIAYSNALTAYNGRKAE